MKLNSNEISRILHLLFSGKITAILLHGPNTGLSAAIINKLISQSDYLISRFTFNEVSPETLSSKLQERNFFGQKELIKIYETPATINNSLKSVLKNENAENILCFFASESLPPKGLRKFFEDNERLISVGCYEETQQSLSSAIIKKINSTGKKLEEEALHYLRQHISGDRQVVSNEISKLLYYTHDKQVITLEDVQEAVNLDLVATGENLCAYFVNKQMNEFLNEISNLQRQGINEVLMIRALMRFYTNVYYASLYIEGGMNIDMALKSISPPIFFKLIPTYKQLLKNSSSRDAIGVLERLYEAEVQYKTNPTSFDLYGALTSHS